MKRGVHYPEGCWPMEMTSEMAAAYCCEPSVEAFLAKVRRGIYSAPASAPHCRDKWHKFKLNRDIARRHNLQWDSGLQTENAADLIA